jgi:hypothetical protein
MFLQKKTLKYMESIRTCVFTQYQRRSVLQQAENRLCVWRTILFHTARLLTVQVANTAYERVFERLSFLAKKTLFLSSEHTHHENEIISIQRLKIPWSRQIKKRLSYSKSSIRHRHASYDSSLNNTFILVRQKGSWIRPGSVIQVLTWDVKDENIRRRFRLFALGN